MSNTTAVILAAGLGKRTKFPLPKMLLPLAGKPLVSHITDRVLAIFDTPPVIVSQASYHNQLATQYPQAKIVTQPEANGTADALLCAIPEIGTENILVLLGDCPLVSRELLSQMQSSDTLIKMVSFKTENPTGYGRLIRDQVGRVLAIREEKDASVEEKSIQEVNSGIMLIKKSFLMASMPKLTKNNAQGELYLTDLIALAAGDIEVISEHSTNVLGVNTLAQLSECERIIQQQKAADLLANGVLIVDPTRVTLRGQVQIGPGCIIEPNVLLENVTIGDNSYIGANCQITNSTLAKNIHIQASSVIDQASIAEGCEVGPMAHLRTGTMLSPNVCVGNFVEIKSSCLSNKTKVKHLSYLGNATIGASVNIGAGAIICNYDGQLKHPTHIDDGAFIGSNSSLIAPLKIGKGALIAAGSTISYDVPSDHIAFGRARQSNKPQKIRKED